MSSKGDAIRIGKSKIEDADEQARLACDISIGGERREMFFGVAPEYKDCLTVGRADPFLAVLVNFAMRTGRNIICEDPVSERLLFSLRKLYIKTLSFWSEEFTSITIEAQTVAQPIPSRGAVGCAMSFGCDSLYTLYKHWERSEYPITHLCNFNNGVYSDRTAFEDHSRLVGEYAEELGLESVFVDTNVFELMPERFLDVYTQRNMACVLALQGLFETYLYSSGHDESHVKICADNPAYYDVVSADAFSTESMRFILSGCECSRVDKLRELCSFEGARAHLHPCYKSPIGKGNCGKCKKDIRDMLLLYVWGEAERFGAVYDFSDYEGKLPMNLAILISLSDDHLYKEALEEYVNCGGSIPPQSHTYAKMLRKAMEHEKQARNEGQSTA